MQSLKQHGGGRRGYWANHEYERRSVVDLQVESFCGWPILLDMLEAAETPGRYSPQQHPYCSERDKVLVSATFETGGRMGEVIRLQKSMFKIDNEWVTVEKMPLLKRWRKVKGSNKTKTIPASRDFVFPRREPLSENLVQWVDQSDDYLFVSPRKRLKHMSYSRAYQVILDLADRVNFSMWPHRLRSERASQLGNEYKWNSDKIMRFFGWESVTMAMRYAHAGIDDMKKAYNI